VTYLPAWAREAVEAWLTFHPALLLPIKKAGRIEGRRLRSQAVLDILVRVGESAGVDGFAPHDMRRTFIT
jgi:integrase